MPNGISFGSTPAKEPDHKIDIVSEGSSFTVKPVKLEAKSEEIVRFRAQGAKIKIKFPDKDVFGILELNLDKGKHKDLKIRKEAQKDIPHKYGAYIGDRSLDTGGVDPDIIIR